MYLGPQALKNILFLDIETVSCKISYEELEEELQALWHKQVASLCQGEEQTSKKLFSERAAIYAEFGKVIVIGLGLAEYDAANEPRLHVYALSGHDEKALLEEFKNFLETRCSPQGVRMCAHNGKEFDFPYLCRRMLINGIPLPPILDTYGKKPWEVNHLDTMELWKFGDRKNFTSLHLLATIFGLNSSKNKMDGSQVHHYYYQKKDLAAIADYCVQDVIVTTQLFLKLHCLQLIKEKNIVFN
jgi:DNA polymerase elongation subunit (family B)